MASACRADHLREQPSREGFGDGRMATQLGRHLAPVRAGEPADDGDQPFATVYVAR